MRRSPSFLALLVWGSWLGELTRKLPALPLIRPASPATFFPQRGAKERGARPAVSPWACRRCVRRDAANDADAEPVAAPRWLGGQLARASETQRRDGRSSAD